MWLACISPGHVIPVTDVLSPAVTQDVIVTPEDCVVEVLHGLGPDHIVARLYTDVVCRLPMAVCQTCTDGPVVTVAGRYAIIKCFTPPRSFWVQYVGTREIERVDAAVVQHRGDPLALAMMDVRWRAIAAALYIRM